jgi:hypothetical protein
LRFEVTAILSPQPFVPDGRRPSPLIAFSIGVADLRGRPVEQHHAQGDGGEGFDDVVLHIGCFKMLFK